MREYRRPRRLVIEELSFIDSAQQHIARDFYGYRYRVERNARDRS
jgi:hypothetical protein